MCVAFELGKLTVHKSRFQEEFPELAVGADDKAVKREDEVKELQYGPGPSLRPQSKPISTLLFIYKMLDNRVLLSSS